MTNEKIAELSGIPLDCVRQTIKRVPNMDSAHN